MKKVFSVLDFGARAGLDELQTRAIQRCIDECFLQGGGTVEVPAGDYLTGDLRLRTGVTLHLLRGAHLLGSRDPEDYGHLLADELEPLPQADRSDAPWAAPSLEPDADCAFFTHAGSRWTRGLIRAIDAHDVAVIGEEGSCIDGRDCFDELGEEHYRGPHAFNFYRCRNVTLRGYTVKNSANWAHALFDCANIRMQDVQVLAGHDGVHITGCDNVTIEHCAFYTGDDCIAGTDNLNVLARGCQINTACSGLRFGGTNALFESCHFFGPARYLFRGSLTDEEKRSGQVRPAGGHRYNMLSLLTYYADRFHPIRYTPGNIVIRDCTCENADRFLHYNFSGNEPWQCGRPLSGVTFEKVRAAGIRYPLHAYGAPEEPFSLTLRDCSLEFAADVHPALVWAANWALLSLTHVSVRGLGGCALVKAWSDGPAPRLQACDLGAFRGELLRQADEPFVCAPI